LKQIDSWKGFLGKEWLLSADEKKKLRTLIAGKEILVWAVIHEMNQSIGPWDIQIVFLVGDHARPLSNGSSETWQKWIAINRITGEPREAFISAEAWIDRTKYGAACKQAYETLGLWSEAYKGCVHHGITSNPVDAKSISHHTKVVIPRLYAFLIPYYQVRGHYSSKRDILKTENAVYPKQLLEIMLDILHFEEPEIFRKSNIAQIKAVLQRHFHREKSRSTKSLRLASNPSK
jgi:hypothetical protein